MNAKFSIGIVVAIVLQVSGFVWWIAQQSQTIDTLKNEVAELTARTEVEKEVTLINVSQVRQFRQFGRYDDLIDKNGKQNSREKTKLIRQIICGQNKRKHTNKTE